MSLPDGWIQRHDSHYNHTYWVDTQSNPPRAIWVHPYEDEQFLAEQRAREEAPNAPNIDAPPSYDAATEGRAAEGEKSRSPPRPEGDPPNAVAGPSSQREPKRGVFARLRDKAIGTKEEREEQKRIRAEQAEERARRARIREQREREERRRRRAEQARQARMRELQEREAYMRAYGGYAPYNPSYSGYGPGARQTTGLGGGDNTAALLLGGLAGGLLLGDILGGGGFGF